jgi:hypothetical protein
MAQTVYKYSPDRFPKIGRGKRTYFLGKTSLVKDISKYLSEHKPEDYFKIM